MNKELSQRIINLYEENTLFRDFNGYILMKEQNEIVFNQGFGYSDFQKKKTADENTVYNLGSVTKQFTAMCILLLEQKGLLSIDESIGTYLPDFLNRRNIKVRDMLNMISGIPEYWCKPEWHESPERTAEDSYGFIKTLTDYQPPREKFEYSNSNYIVLGKLIEKVTGQSLADYMNLNIFKPLDMTRTSFLTVNQNDTNIAIGYKSPHVAKWEKTVMLNSFAGAAGMYSTAADLCKWDEALYTDKLLNKELMAEFYKPVLSGYAMGWFVDGPKIFHGGDAPGFSVRFTRVCSRKLVIILLCNFEGCKESNMGHYSNMLEQLI